VSRISNPQNIRLGDVPANFPRPAECNSATQQIANLRYLFWPEILVPHDDLGRSHYEAPEMPQFRPAPAFLPSRLNSPQPQILHFPDNSPARSRHAFAMKLTCLLLFLTATVATAFAADPLTESFQRGILAEESRRDLGAAAASYAEVIRLADAQRELVATALFRLAEVRCRLGQTNEAEADYRRLLREYPEQTNLVGLAQVWLPPRGVPSLGLAALTDRLARAQMELDARVREHAELAAFMERVEKLPDAEIAQALELRQPTAELTRLRSDRNTAEQALARLSTDFASDHPDVQRTRVVIRTIGEQLAREVGGIWVSLSARRKELKQEIEERERSLQVLEARLAQERHDSGVVPGNYTPATATEQLLEEEIKLAEQQAAILQKRFEVGGGTPQGELLQAQRDVLALKRQLAGLRRPDLAEPTIQPTPPTLQTDSKSRWVTVFGQVRNPGMLKLPDDQRMDLFEAITAQGGITDKGDPERIQVGRGTNLFRFRLNQLMTNRFELQHEDKVQVREKLF